MKHLFLLLLFTVMGCRVYAQDDLVLKNFSYLLPTGWSLQDRLENGWVDKDEPTPPIFIVDCSLFNINTSADMNAYIAMWVGIIKQECHDAAETAQKNKIINGVAFTVATIAYSRNCERWQDVVYFTPIECGQICHGYVFTIRAPYAQFEMMQEDIAFLEKNLQINQPNIIDGAVVSHISLK